MKRRRITFHIYYSSFLFISICGFDIVVPKLPYVLQDTAVYAYVGIPFHHPNSSFELIPTSLVFTNRCGYTVTKWFRVHAGNGGRRASPFVVFVDRASSSIFSTFSDHRNIREQSKQLVVSGEKKGKMFATKCCRMMLMITLQKKKHNIYRLWASLQKEFLSQKINVDELIGNLTRNRP